MLTRMAPIFAVASWAIVHSAQLGDQTPTRSPLAMPRGDQAAGEVVDAWSSSR